jgi:hypothetical protein
MMGSMGHPAVRGVNVVELAIARKILAGHCSLIAMLLGTWMANQLEETLVTVYGIKGIAYSCIVMGPPSPILYHKLIRVI